MLRRLQESFRATPRATTGSEIMLESVNRVFFLVKDLTASVEFYSRLGLQVIHQSEWSIGAGTANSVVFDLGNGAGLTLTEPTDAYGIGLVADMPADRCTQLGFMVDDLDSFYRASLARDVQYPMPPQEMRTNEGAGGKMLFCNDPDGYGIIIFQRPR